MNYDYWPITDLIEIWAETRCMKLNAMNVDNLDVDKCG